MSKEFWNQDNVVMLIHLYESHKLLWDTTHKEYKNKFRRKDSYSRIATELGINNVDEVKKKIEILLVQYRREIKAAVSTSGMNAAEKKKPWWGLTHFKFLEDKHTPRETISNMAQSSDTSAERNFCVNQKLEISSDISSPPVKSSSKSSISRCNTPDAAGSGVERFSAIRRAKRAKRKRFDEAYKVIKCCLSDIQQERAQWDEYSVCGENVANRVRKLKHPMRVCRLQMAIDNMIFKAEMDEFEERNKNKKTTAIAGNTTNSSEYSSRNTAEESMPSANSQPLE